MRQIGPYGHIGQKIQVLPDLGGSGFPKSQKTEMLKCAWEQFPPVRKSRCEQNTKSRLTYISAKLWIFVLFVWLFSYFFVYLPVFYTFETLIYGNLHHSLSMEKCVGFRLSRRRAPTTWQSLDSQNDPGENPKHLFFSDFWYFPYLDFWTCGNCSQAHFKISISTFWKVDICGKCWLCRLNNCHAPRF